MARAWFSSLRVHLIILVLIAVIPALALVIYTAAEHRRESGIEAQSNALRLAKLASRNQEQLTERARQLLVGLSHESFLRTGDSDACTSLFSDLLKNYPSYTNLGAVKPDGTVFCSAVPMGQSMSFSERPAIKRAIAARGFASGDYEIGPITHKAAAGFGYPIFDDSGELKSVLFAALDLSWLNQFAEEAELPADSTLTVIDKNGTVLIRSADAEKWVGTSAPDAPVVRTILSQGTGVTEGPGLDGTSRLFAFAPLDSVSGTAGAYISIGIPVKAAYADAERALYRHLIWIALAALLGMAAAWLGGDLLVLRKLNVLLTSARRLSAGQWSARTRLTGGPQELADLGKAFDEMAANLERRHVENMWADEEIRRALDESRQRRAEASALLESARAVLEYPDFKDAAQSILNSCKTLVGGAAGYVSVLTSDKTHDHVAVLEMCRPIDSSTPSLSAPITGLREEVCRTGKVAYRNAFPNNEWKDFVPEGHPGLNNLLVAPLILKGEVVGLLGLANKPGGFTENDARVATAFGELAAVALLNARTLESLESSEERFRTVAQSAGDGMLTVDSNGNIVLWNHAAERMYGYLAEEVIGTPIFDLIPERERPAVRGSVERLRSSNMANAVERPFEGFGLRKDGTEFPGEISLSFWKTREGNFFTAILRDITERKQSEQLFRTLSSNSPIGIYIIQDGKFKFVNPQFERDTGYPEEELIGTTSLDLILPEDRERVRASAVRMLKGETLRPFEYRVTNRKGETRWIMETVSSIQYKGRRAVLANFMDITERKQAEEALAKSHDFYLTLFDGLPNPIRRTDLKGKCDYFNKSWLSFRGRTLEQEMGDGWHEGIHPEEFARCDQIFWDAFTGRKPFEIEYRLRRYDGEYRWMIETGRPFNDLEGNFAGYIGSSYDITDRKQQEQQLAYLATHDPLTGLPNRRSLEDAMKRVVARARRGTLSSLLFLDVDNFKLVNDTLGHTVGDRALITLTRLLQEHLRAEDLLARLGGDEFAVLLEATGVEDARVVAERMRRAVDEFSVMLDGLSFNLSFSMGLVVINGQDSPAVVLSQADAAMYRAKEQGRNRIVVYQQDEDDVAWLSEANKLAIILKDALKENKFIICYQPVVRLSDGQIQYYEALIRLRGEDEEIISAGEFITAAERFGLMPQLTRWIVKEVIHTLQEYPQIRLSVNLSGLDLSDDSLPDFVAQCFQDCDVDATRLGFEITETAIIKDLVSAERWMRRLKALGCSFALDDFGTGYLSFVHLRNLPVDHLKIDGSLIRTLDSDPAQRALVQAVQTLAGTQGQDTVAEWVESESITQILRDIGVTCVQGYYLGKPNPDFPRRPIQPSPPQPSPEQAGASED